MPHSGRAWEVVRLMEPRPSVAGGCGGQGRDQGDLPKVTGISCDSD